MLKHIIICLVILQLSLSLVGGQDDYRKNRNWKNEQVNEEKCGNNEERLKCGPACPRTCEYYNTKCNITSNECSSGCYCKEGYVRVGRNCLPGCEVCCPDPECLEKCMIYLEPCAGGCYCFQDPDTLEYICTNVTDITVRCPKPNQVFDLCPKNCTKTCSDPTGSRCSPPECAPKCVCKEGYVRGPGKECILPSCCPQTYGSEEAKSCEANQVYKNCGQRRYCPTLLPPTPDPLPFAVANTCYPGCFCDTDYYRNSTDDCVLESECDDPTSSGE